jgi:alpha-glucosidase (family GH31 glycosyl hydrolase)
MKKKNIVLKITILIMGMVFLAGCKNSTSTKGEIGETSPVSTVTKQEELILTAEGLSHEPYGWDNLYDLKEVPLVWWDRTPRDPKAEEMVEIAAAVWKDAADMDIWLEWTLNEETMEPIPCKHRANLEDSGQKKGKYVGEMGPFLRGDKIEYTICAGKNGTPEKKLGPYSFSVLEWESLNRVEKAVIQENTLVLEGETDSFRPKIYLTFTQKGTLQMKVEPLEEAQQNDLPESAREVRLTESDTLYTASDGNLTLEIGKEPYGFRLIDNSGNELVSDTKGEGLEILTDGKLVKEIRLNLNTPEEEEFYGFGMKYNTLNQRGETVDTYCVNWYTEQNDKTYTPVPYYFVPDKYGFYIDSTYYSRFNIDTARDNVCRIDVTTGGDKNTGVDFYFFAGSNQEIADSYTDIVGKPVLPPVWAFGPWISANEWNKQTEVMEQLEQTIKYDIPTSVIVLEAWSDEETFYTFNDSEFKAGGGDYVPKLSDFTFGGRWPDPKGMVDELHNNGIKVLLWQIPVLKYSGSATLQSIRDQNYAEEKGYVLKENDGSSYRIPSGTWFGNSLMIDFTNKEGTQWFLSKREYLLKELGIDGFKTDGGEFVWGRDIISYDGTKGDELRNAYPDQYGQAYFDYGRQWNEQAITFSRAGGASMQNHPICWIGDQKSTPEAFRDAMYATLNTSMSGIPFVAWDIAGFSGDVPSSDLYQRSVAQAAFSPIMQVHSETSGDPSPSQARTPWNMAERKQSEDCLNTYRYFANVRMNLLPYIYSEARHSSLTGEPLMRSMAYAYPWDKKAQEFKYQYMFGSNLLVVPIIGLKETEIEVYLPEGTWYGLFNNKPYKSGTHTIECPLGELPVFVREGAILPMNLNEAFELGGSIGNELESYNNLTFRIYPGNGSYLWYDYVNDCDVELSFSADGEELTVKGLLTTATIELPGRKNSVEVNGKEIQGTYDSVTDSTRLVIKVDY